MMGYANRKLQGCDPKMARAIVDLLFQDDYDHLELVRSMGPSKTSGAVHDIWARHVRPQPKAPRQPKVYVSPRSPRPDDTQAGILREAILATGVSVPTYVYRTFGKRYYIVYSISEDPAARVPLPARYLRVICADLGLDLEPFGNLL